MDAASQKILQNTRNIGISAHIDSGKTTLTERILFYAGRIHKIEEVRGGGAGATMDHMDLERERNHHHLCSHHSAVGKTRRSTSSTLLGMDFTVEVERSLRVLDGAILVLCGVSGVQSQSITVDRQMKRYKVPRLAFINKLDRWVQILTGDQGIRDVLSLNAVAMQLPIGLEENHDGVVDLVTMKAYFLMETTARLSVRGDPANLVDDAQEKRQEMLEAVSMFDEQMMEDLLEEKRSRKKQSMQRSKRE